MNIEQFEEIILSELKKIVENILTENRNLSISAKSRAGAEISDFLEDKFIEKTKRHKYFRDSIASPKGATKNPWDALTNFYWKNHKETIWIDFKAVKISSADSNPDIGTPDKIIKLIQSGFFYIVYIFVYYSQIDEGLEFVKRNNNLVKIYFLKDINSTFRRNPKNQLQVNISAEPQYRTREDFIKLLFLKIKESHQRQIVISEKTLKKIEEQKLEEKIIELNKKLEQNLLKKI